MKYLKIVFTLFVCIIFISACEKEEFRDRSDHEIQTAIMEFYDVTNPSCPLQDTKTGVFLGPDGSGFNKFIREDLLESQEQKNNAAICNIITSTHNIITASVRSQSSLTKEEDEIIANIIYEWTDKFKDRPIKEIETDSLADFEEEILLKAIEYLNN